MVKLLMRGASVEVIEDPSSAATRAACGLLIMACDRGCAGAKQHVSAKACLHGCFSFRV